MRVCVYIYVDQLIWQIDTKATESLASATENLVNAKENLYESKLKARAYDRYVESMNVKDGHSSKRLNKRQ